MHMRVTAERMRPGMMGEAVAIMREAFAAYGAAGGFAGGYVAGDEGSGDGVVVTLWESAEAAQAALGLGRPILARLASCTISGAPPSPPPSYAVLLQQ